MIKSNASLAQQVAEAAVAFEQRRTGHTPRSVSVVMSDNTLMITLHGALSPAERALAKSPEGAAQMQNFHRQLFSSAADSLRQEIKESPGSRYANQPRKLNRPPAPSCKHSPPARSCRCICSPATCRVKRGVEVDRLISHETEVLIMLVLTRKCLEVVVVGGADGLQPLLKVIVLGIEKGKVRLGFEAREDVPVNRLEVWERIRTRSRSPRKAPTDSAFVHPNTRGL